MCVWGGGAGGGRERGRGWGSVIPFFDNQSECLYWLFVKYSIYVYIKNYSAGPSKDIKKKVNVLTHHFFFHVYVLMQLIDIYIWTSRDKILRTH